MIGWVIVLFVLLLFIFVLVSRLYITFHYSYEHGDEMIQMSVRLFHMAIYRKEMDPKNILRVSQKEWNSKSLRERMQYTFKYLNKMFQRRSPTVRFIHRHVQKIHVHHFSWSTEVGTRHASITGLACGGIWTLKGMLCGWLRNKLNLYLSPDIRVTPYYQQPVMTSRLHCIVSIGVGNAMVGWMHARRVIPAKEMS